MSKVIPADECSKDGQWELSTENKGLHMHYMAPNGEAEVKTYARCSMKRTFTNKVRKTVKYASKWDADVKAKQEAGEKTQVQLYDDRNLELKAKGNNKLYVRSGMNVYNDKKEMIDQRSNDW